MKPYTPTTSCGLEFEMTLSRRKFARGTLCLVTLAGAAPALLGRAALAGPADYAKGDMVLGNPEASITIIEYASFTCPHCATFHADTLPQLKQAWLDSGKAKMIYRDFPLDELALRAAMLARCAGKARYFAFVNVLFAQQNQWARAKDPIGALGRIARLGGIGKGAFEACMADRALGDTVLQSRVDASQKYDISSTPTFIINGEKHPGALSFEQIDAILNKAS